MKDSEKEMIKLVLKNAGYDSKNILAIIQKLEGMTEEERNKFLDR